MNTPPNGGASDHPLDPRVHSLLDGPRVVFFTGGDQLKLTSQLGDTPVFTRTRDIYENGGLNAGTSAGASVMCETMLVTGASGKSPTVGDVVQMAPGLGVIRGVIVDQHFAERGRISRLLGAVAQNPRIVGIGIDEDTAIHVETPAAFTVLGTGGVYVVDARDVTQSNVVEGETDQTLSVFNVKLHLLNAGDEYDLVDRTPHSRNAVESRQR